MSVYRDEAARERMLGWYDRFQAGLTHPATGRFVETRHGRTHVLVSGPEDAPPLVCFHGAMGTAASALSLVQTLAGRFRIYFPDTVGQPGRSAETHLPMRNDELGWWALDVLDALGLSKPAFCGASMGGWIALSLARVAPERVGALSLWTPGGLVNGTAWNGLRLGWLSLKNYLFPNEQSMRAMFSEIFTDEDEGWFAFYMDAWRSLKMDRTMPRLYPDDAFRGLEAPVQVIAHGEDSIFPATALITRARTLFPRVEDAHIEPGYSHVGPVRGEGTERLQNRIADFLLAHVPAQG